MTGKPWWPLISPLAAGIFTSPFAEEIASRPSRVHRRVGAAKLDEAAPSVQSYLDTADAGVALDLTTGLHLGTLLAWAVLPGPLDHGRHGDVALFARGGGRGGGGNANTANGSGGDCGGDGGNGGD